MGTNRVLQPQGTPPHNLPAQRSSFVGREREVLEVRQALAMRRLLTLTGVGGSGKTRLALEVARGLIDAYPDGVWLVELAPLPEETLVPKAVAEALEVSERPGESLTDTLADVLGDRQLLLVVDNCEHLLEAIAPLVDVLLDSCPRVRILATSREALGLEGEIRWLVPPLSAPEVGHTLSSEELEGYESVRLFVERARGHDPAFSSSPYDALAMAQICSTLEGIPLAIELAAARVGTLSSEQIAQRLTDSLKLLTSGARTAVNRHRTLKGALDWSFELLSAEEKELLGRLSVFMGGWTLEAAEAVGAGGGVEEEDVLDLLSGLVEKSLVVTRGSDEGDVRYRMLEPVSQYGWEKLQESGETEGVKESHAGYYLALAERAEPELIGSRQETWLELLDAEIDNLRAALSWSLNEAGGEERAELGLRAAAALGQFWQLHGPGEGRAWLEAALERDQVGSSAVRAKALSGLGWIVLFQGDHELTVAALEEAMELYRDLGDLSGEAIALAPLGYAAVHAGEIERFPALSEQCEALLQKPLNRHAAAYLLIFLGMVSLEAGHYERTVALLEESRTLFRALGDLRGVCMSGFILGMTELKQGNLQRGTAVLEEGLPLTQRTKDKLGSAYYLMGMGGVAVERGQPVRAARLWGAAEALRKVIGLPLSYFDLAHSGYEARLAAARSQLEEAIWEAAWSEGWAMSPEQAIEYALSAEEPSATLPSSVTTLPSPLLEQEPPAGLTSREVEVLGLVATGMTSAQVATQLFLSPRTVDTHLTSIYHKLGVTSRAAATRFALEQGIA